VGTKISICFNGILYKGTITNNNCCWYSIQYVDGDLEDTTHREVMRHTVQTTTPSYIAGWSKGLNAMTLEEETKTNIARNTPRDTEHRAYAITHPVSGKQMEYRLLIRDSEFTKGWTQSGSNETGRLVQGVAKNADGTQRVKGTNTMIFIHKSKVSRKQKGNVRTIRLRVQTQKIRT